MAKRTVRLGSLKGDRPIHGAPTSHPFAGVRAARWAQGEDGITFVHAGLN